MLENPLANPKANTEKTQTHTFDNSGITWRRLLYILDTLHDPVLRKQASNTQSKGFGKHLIILFYIKSVGLNTPLIITQLVGP